MAGLRQVTSTTPRTGNETVYNLEVQGEHVYLVGSLGTLVHNTYPDLADDLVKSALRPSKAGSETSRGIQSLSKKFAQKPTVFGAERSDKAAEKFIREILNDSQTTIARPGKGVDIRDSLGRGVRITHDEFDTFLIPGGLTY